MPPNFSYPKGKAIKPVKARIKIADIDIAKQIDSNEKAVIFDVELNAGKTMLQSWFIDANGRSRGAYFVYVTKL